MEKKTAPEMTVISKEIRTTLKDLLINVGDLPKEIFEESLANKLHPAGPQYWIYEWESDDLEAPFNVKICLPVATFGNTLNSDKFKLEKIAPFNHVSRTHYGAWENLKETYCAIMGEMKAQQITPGKVCREVYVNCDFENLENNITEVQFQVN